jgi:hypothetical protein
VVGLVECKLTALGLETRVFELGAGPSGLAQHVARHELLASPCPVPAINNKDTHGRPQEAM